jgi:O-antigen ligase
LRAPSSNRNLPTLAIYALIAIVVASLAVHVLVLRQTIGADGLRRLAGDLFAGEYFLGTGGAELDAAMRLIEGLLLFHAASTLVSIRSWRGPLLIRTTVIGAATAGALNLWRIWLGALQLESPVAAFFGYLRTLRYNTHYTDLNAAGSYYMMALLPALMLAWRRDWWRWAPAALLILVSLILSGSRTAIAAGIVAALGAWYLAQRRRGSQLRPQMTAARIAVVVALAVVCLGAGLLLAVRNDTSAVSAVRIRLEFARASVRMLRSAPLFGVGIGQYPSRAGEFTSPELVLAYPPSVHENAHNNFLQVLAELGIVGFAVFIWILAGATARIIGQPARDTHDRLFWCATAGAGAFVLSWLGGHPLLLDPPAFSFWILLGALAGWGGIGGQHSRRTSTTAIPMAVLGVALLISLPLRVRAEFGRTELDHQGIGLSLWQDANDGIRYRLAGAVSTVFVPAAARVITVPLRAVNPHQAVSVELRLDSRLADVVRVPGDRWLMLRLPMPPQPDTRYRALGFRVRVDDDESASSLLMIGKVTPQ